MATIAMIPIDSEGNKLFIKDLKTRDGEVFVKMKSTYNDMPFIDVKLHPADNGQSCAIRADNGAILFKFGAWWFDRILE